MKTIQRLATVGLGVAAILFGTARPADAIVITDVNVTIGAASFTAGTVGWNFPVSLNPGEDLVLTQNKGGYDFDTSDVLGPQNFAQISVTVNGVTKVFTDLAQILNVKGLDTSNTVDNEAQNYGAAFKGKGFLLYLGYVDNTHTGACGAWANSVGLNGSATCFPSPFFGATVFQGTGALLPAGLVQTNPFHCQPGVPECYEGGVIRIVATAPEPATMALLLTGVALIGVRQYRRRPQRS